jgi:hypothetical protein
MNHQCKNYFVYEEGFFSRRTLGQIKSQFASFCVKPLSIKDRIYVIRQRLIDLTRFIASEDAEKVRILFYYLFSCYSNPRGFFFFYAQKYKGAWSLSKDSFPGQGTNNTVLEKPTHNEVAYIQDLASKFSHLAGVPILLIHKSDRDVDIFSAISSLSSCGSSCLVVRPHPSLNSLSLVDICATKNISIERVHPDSLELSMYPLEIVVHALRSPLLNAKNSSINLYLSLYETSAE